MTSVNDPVVLRLLVVDDFEPLRKVVRAVLSRSASPTLRAAAISEAADLGEARDKLGTELFHMVLLDLSLPDGNGIDLVHEMATAAHRPVVIAVSGDGPSRRKALEAGCAGFLMKPYTPDELVEMVTEQSPVPVLWG